MKTSQASYLLVIHEVPHRWIADNQDKILYDWRTKQFNYKTQQQNNRLVFRSQKTRLAMDINTVNFKIFNDELAN